MIILKSLLIGIAIGIAVILVFVRGNIKEIYCEIGIRALFWSCVFWGGLGGVMGVILYLL